MQDFGPSWAVDLPTSSPDLPSSHAGWGRDSDEDDVGDAFEQVLGGSGAHTFYTVPVHQRLSHQWPSWGGEEEFVGASIEDPEDVEAAAWNLMEEVLHDATPRTHRRMMQLVAERQRSNGGDALEGPEGPCGGPACGMSVWCGVPRPCIDGRKADAHVTQCDANAGDGRPWRRPPLGSAVQPAGLGRPSLFWKLPPSSTAPVPPWQPQPGTFGSRAPLGSRTRGGGGAACKARQLGGYDRVLPHPTVRL